MLDNHESPAPADYHHDDAFIIPAEASFFELADTLGRKLNQMRDLCATLSNLDDSAISGVFWFLSDMMTYCDNLTTRIIAANPEKDTPEPTAPGTGRYIAIPENAYNDLSLSLESLSAQQLIASDTEFYQTNTLETISKFMLGMHRETERAQQLLATGSAIRSAGDE